MGITKGIAAKKKGVVISSAYRFCKKWIKHETRTEKMRDFIKVDVLKEEYGQFIMKLVDHVDLIALKQM